MALQCGEELHLEGIANDTGIKAKTISNYIEILEDTLLGFEVPAFQKTKKRKAIARSKFYLFDVGVVGFLCGRTIESKKSELFGKALEIFIAQELRAYLSYFHSDKKQKIPLQYWRSVSKQEVDFVLGSEIAIEVKATSRATDHDLKGLLALQEENLCKKFFLVSMDEFERTKNGIQFLHISSFLKKLWAGEICTP